VKFNHYTVNLKNFRESFWFRLFSSLIVVIIIILSVFSFMHIYREGSKVNENLAKKGKMVAGFLASSSRTGIFAENTEALENIAEGVMNEEDIASVSFYSADWNVLYQTSKKGGMSNRPDFHRNISGQLREPHSFKLVETPDSIEYFTPVTLEVFPTMAESLYFEDTDITQTEKIIGYVHVGMDKKNLPAEIKAIIYRDLTLLFVISLAGIITIYIATRKVTVPLLKLTENVRMLGIEGSAEKIDFESNDEIGRLAAAFNKMAEDLRRREEEKRALEEQLLQGKKMEALGTLSRGIAHDFNNILSTIQGASFIMKKKMDEDNPLQQYVKKIHISLARAQNLIQSLVSFSRGQATEPVPCNLNEVITRLIPFCENLSTENIQCTFSLSKCDLVVSCDATQIEQVLLNLISNACHAMPGGGVLSVAADSVVIHSLMNEEHPGLMPGTYAHISVTDTGIGIREDIRERIFEPFFTTKEVGEGIGLGLSIAYGIVKQYNGLIDVSSRPGEGTTFDVYLPMEEEKKNSIFPE
jgi:signal transduction histidine kinase